MSTLSINQLTEQQKVEVLAEVCKSTSENETKWVSFNKFGVQVYPFSKRLDSYDVEGLQEIYYTEHDEVHFLGYLIDQDWKNLKLNNNPLKIAKQASRKVWSRAV